MDHFIENIVRYGVSSAKEPPSEIVSKSILHATRVDASDAPVSPKMTIGGSILPSGIVMPFRHFLLLLPNTPGASAALYGLSDGDKHLLSLVVQPADCVPTMCGVIQWTGDYQANNATITLPVGGPREFCLAALSIGFECLRLMACKNIITEAVNHSQHTSNILSRKQHGKKTKSVYRYHILKVIVPRTREQKTFRQLADEVGKMPLHRVRGHKKHYTGENGGGLYMGRYVATIFVPEHARGNAKNGIVDKDYRLVKASETTC